MATLGPFQLGEPLGRGGMGVVFSAMHAPTGVAAAVKVLGVAPELADRVHGEAALAAGLDHPHLVPILDHGLVPEGTPGLRAGAPYLVMLRARETLASHLGGLAWPQLRGVLLEILDGLAHAHARGVLHCDVKPSNVLLGVQRDPRQPMPCALSGLALADFGVARRLGAVDAQPLGGTAGYMPPEQVDADLEAFGPWTDLYAVGALAWALATGAPPEPGTPFVPRAPMPEALGPWLDRLRAAQPHQRFARASQAASAIPDDADLARGSPPAPAPPETTTRVVSRLVSISTLALEVDRPVRPRPSPETERAEVPTDWRTRRPAWPSPVLQDAGRGVWRLREPPLVAREPERDALWAALRRVDTTGRAHLVALTGPPGVGRTRLLAWIRRRAHEVACAETAAVTGSLPPVTGALSVVTVDDADGRLQGEVTARAGTRERTLFVVAGTGEPWAGAEEIAVAPLHPADLEELVRRSLPLAPGLVVAAARDAAGLPRAVVATLDGWASAGGLERAPPLRSLQALVAQVASASDLLARGDLRGGAEAVHAASDAADALGIEEGHRLRAEIAALRLRLDPSAVPPGERTSLAEHLAACRWPDLRSEGLARMAVIASNRGRPQDGHARAVEAVRIADGLGLVPQQVTGRSYLGHIALLLGDTAGARSAFDRILALAPSHPEPAVAAVTAHLGFALLSRRTGRWQDAAHHAEHALALATEAGLALECAKALRTLGSARHRAGQFAQAAALWRSYIAQARTLGLTSDLPNAYSDLGEALRQLGAPSEAERALQRAVALLRDAEQSDVVPRMNLARLYVDTERFEEAWQLIGPAVVEVSSLGWASLRPQVLALRIAVAAARDREEDARRALDALQLEDPETLRVDPSVAELLALASLWLGRAGWRALADRAACVSI